MDSLSNIYSPLSKKKFFNHQMDLVVRSGKAQILDIQYGRERQC